MLLRPVTYSTIAHRKRVEFNTVKPLNGGSILGRKHCLVYIILGSILYPLPPRARGEMVDQENVCGIPL
jgi:hypothetical protein